MLTSGFMYAYAASFLIELFTVDAALGVIVLLIIIQALLIFVLGLRLYNMRKWSQEAEAP